jgi:hypothetical protein
MTAPHDTTPHDTVNTVNTPDQTLKRPFSPCAAGASETGATGAEVAAESVAAQSAAVLEAVLELYRRQWRSGERRDAVCDGEVFLGDPRSGAQVHLWRHPDGPRVFNVIPAGQRHYAYRCWVTESAAGRLVDGEFVARPIPDAALDVLRHALPIPRQDSLFGYRDGTGRTIALYMAWADGEIDHAAHIAHWVLAGEPDPDLWSHDGTYLDPRKWWQAVDTGLVSVLDQDIHQSRQPVESSRRGEGFDYIVVRGSEPWTGVPGPALYADPTTATDLTLQAALRLPGQDFRGNFAPTHTA